MDRAQRYTPRVVDDELDELIQSLPAIVLEGPKGVGKTATAERRVSTTFRLDDVAQRSIRIQRRITISLPALPPPFQRRRIQVPVALSRSVCVHSRSVNGGSPHQP